MAAKEQIGQLLDRAQRQGFRIGRTRSNHYVVRTSSGDWVCNVGSTVSDKKAYLLVRSHLRRAGFQGN